MEARVGRINHETTRIECDGISVGGRFLPPFQLEAGGAICLHVEHCPIPWYEGLLQALKGETVHSGLRVLGSAAYLARPMPRRRWFGRWNDSSAQQWLISEGGLSEFQASSVLKLVGVPPELRIGWMGWNERTLLALEACFLKPPSVVIIDTAGNDPSGVELILNRTATRPVELALIYVKTILRESEPCLPGGRCLEVAVNPPVTVAVE